MKLTTLQSLLVAVSACAMTAGVEAAIVITEVMSSSAHTAGTNNGDWFELTNTGASALDITGWSWDDNSNLAGSANFGGITSIGAGQSVIFGEESLGTEASWISNWGLSGVTVVNLGGTAFQSFGNGGDSVNIYNAASALIATVTFGTATAGFSFEWDTSGQNLGLSAISENGAFRSASNGQSTGLGPGVDIGSPGVAAVPEPSTFGALAGAAVLGQALLRRRRQVV